MSREDKIEHYTYLRDLVLSDDGTRDLVKEKLEVIDKMRHSQISKTPSLEPRFTPSYDIDIPPEKNIGNDFKERQNQRIENTIESYDKRIEKSIQENFELKGYQEQLEDMNNLNHKEIGILMENDGERKLLDYQKELEQEKIKQERTELKKDEFGKSEFSINHNDAVLDKDQKEIDNIYDRTLHTDLDDNTPDKDLEDIDKKLDPSDDFE